MRRLSAALLVCGLLLPSAASAASDLGIRLTRDYIQPASEHFAAAIAGLDGGMEYLCRSPDEQRAETARQRFRDVVLAWSRLSFLRFGPLVEDNRLERIFFWPDPRGVTLRQVQEILATGDPSALDPATLREKSVAVQGIPALEYVLFGTDSEILNTNSPVAHFRCRYARAIAGNLRSLAEEIEAQWEPGGAMAGAFADPGPDNTLYRDDEEIAAEAIKTMSTGLHFLSDAILVPFVGREPETAKPRLAPLWRSGMTIPFIRGEIVAIREFYTATGFADSLPKEALWIDGSLSLEFRNVVETLDRVDVPVDAAVAGGRGREALIYTLIALKSLRETVNSRLAVAIGVAVGFNALDGD